MGRELDRLRQGIDENQAAAPLAQRRARRTPRSVYRDELRPVLRTGAKVMDTILSRAAG